MIGAQRFHQNLSLGLIAGGQRAVRFEMPSDRDVAASDVFIGTLARLLVVRPVFEIPLPHTRSTEWRKDINTRPHFSGCSALEMLMWTKMIVASANVPKRPIQLRRMLDYIGREHLFDRSDEAFDAPILPGTSGS